MKELRTILVPIVLLFIIVAGHTETAYGQNCLDNDSLIHYTIEMDKKCLTCLINSPKKDSLIENNTIQIYNLKEAFKKMQVIQDDDEQTKAKLNEENQKINLHLTKARRNVKIFGVGGIVIGVVAVLLLE
jgi:hypothetical protein